MKGRIRVRKGVGRVKKGQEESRVAGRAWKGG